MKLIHTLTLALALASMGIPAQAAAPSQVPTQQITATPQWKAFLKVALTDSEGQGSKAKQQKLDKLITTATAARKALLDYGQYSFGTLKARYHSARYNAWRQSMEAEYTALVNELFNLDILAFAQQFSDSGEPALQMIISDFPGMLPTQPGSQDFIGEPAICKALRERPVSGSVSLIDTMRQGVELWESHLRDTHKKLSNAYKGYDAWELVRDLLSRSDTSDKEYNRLGQLFRQVEQSWDAYYKAAKDLADTCAEEYEEMGSSGPYRQYMLCRCLLDSRSRILSAITRTFDHEDSNAPSPDCYQVHSPSSAYGFGRIHSHGMLLFRHPGMEGSPWCVACDRLSYCRSFLLVEDSPALQALVRQSPKGGVFELEGYYTVQAGGTPLPAGEYADPEFEDDDYDEIDAGRIQWPQPAANAYRLRPVFHITRLVTQDEDA